MKIIKQFRKISVPILICFLSTQLTLGQTLKEGFPINTRTGRIAIVDSVKVAPGSSQFWVKDIIKEWVDHTAYYCKQNKLAWLPNGIILGFVSIYEKEKGQFYMGGQITYKAPSQHDKSIPEDKMNGSVTFTINFKENGNYVWLEFTSFQYSGPKNELGQFEDRKLVGPDGVRLLSEREKPWNEIRKVYFSWMQLLCRNLKEYIIEHPEKA